MMTCYRDQGITIDAMIAPLRSKNFLMQVKRRMRLIKKKRKKTGEDTTGVPTNFRLICKESGIHNYRFPDLFSP